LRVTATPLVLLLDAEFAESADEYILALFQGLLDNLKKCFNDLGGLTLGERFLTNRFSTMWALVSVEGMALSSLLARRSVPSKGLSKVVLVFMKWNGVFAE